MKLLLDTHAFLWWRLDNRKLKAEARRAISTADLVWVSAASGWEVAIKRAIGKLRLADPFPDMVESSGFFGLPVTLWHAEELVRLPPHHSDPFDRMLIAQARAESAIVVTHDRQFEPYGISVLWT